MICTRCAEAADGVDFGPVPVCSACDQGEVSLYSGTGTVRYHKFRPPYSVTRIKCPGTGRPPRLQTGHDFCKGCSCQHKPAGAWKGTS